MNEKGKIMRKIHLFFLITFLIVFISSCSSTSSPYDDHQPPIAKGAEGFSIGLYNLDDTLEAKRTFVLNGNKFNKKIVFGNMVSHQGEFLLTVFDRGQQIPFKVDGKEYTVFRFSAEAKEYVPIEVSLENLNEDFHSIYFIVFKSPDSAPDNVNGAFEFIQPFYVRVNLLNEKQSQELSPIDPQKLGPSINPGRIHGIFLSQSNDKYKSWFKGTVPESGVLEHHVTIGNKEMERMDFFLVALLDWKQIPFNDAPHLYSELKPGEEVTFTAKIKPANKSKQILNYLLLPSPFADLPDHNPYPLFSPMASFRVQLN